jgi:hypothetical protein
MKIMASYGSQKCNHFLWTSKINKVELIQWTKNDANDTHGEGVGKGNLRPL